MFSRPLQGSGQDAAGELSCGETLVCWQLTENVGIMSRCAVRIKGLNVQAARTVYQFSLRKASNLKSRSHYSARTAQSSDDVIIIPVDMGKLNQQPQGLPRR